MQRTAFPLARISYWSCDHDHKEYGNQTLKECETVLSTMLPFSAHRIRPQRSDDGQPLVCRVKNPALSHALETMILMNVYCKKYFSFIFLAFSLKIVRDLTNVIPSLARTKATMCCRYTGFRHF